ncbi:hypothetical protein Vadar_027135 [Vaccinium darrowii]|uniref:Uncharacterized protein n=1 Tax=Vaccinium darrowii TaxID=229202 RepID=A0ACB7ZEP6_9ERIC|nr:hypothetical protein Vadar_027135 [Vaccinium darrowii]
MQRPTSSARASDQRHHHVIDIGECSPRKKTEGFSDPFERSSAASPGSGQRGAWKRFVWRSLKKHWIHAIPVIVLLSFFILWWFSYPVTLERKDGQIIGVHRIKKALPVKDTRDVDLTILAIASSPNASIPWVPPLKSKAELKPVSPTD